VFQKAGAASPTRSTLDPDEAARADRMLEVDRPARPGARQLLYVGNSQSMAIMDAEPGDLTSPQWLQLLLDRSGPPPVDVRIGSQPNLTQTESLVLLVAAVQQGRPPLDLFLGAQVLEEYRDLGVREEIARRVADPAVAAVLARLVRDNPDLPAACAALEPLLRQRHEGGERPARGWAARLDRAVNGAAERLPLFAERRELRTHIGLSFYAWRNRLLGIHSSTARPVPEATFRSSLELLELILRYARERQIGVALYLAPIRPIQPNPNLAGDVARFRRELPGLAARYGVACVDYVDLVPEALWTNYPDEVEGTSGERDFAHFTGPAHRRLAEALRRDLAAWLGAPAADAP
ncbi:MAG TPA: hypothetical protein VJS92_17135, partial [Candidatus Polarisedimenticolaceae bacterium]|nr:hypothetical protein [Candidatus Polarisedimenticolaceae bacterium]